ncbi:hypothetical protein LTR15_007797 [Elasticomyces elasticus]|nr:hypothetical protein LTR15_007797 [Elasticomyces elasticus]
MTPSPLYNIESYPDPEAETVLVDLSYTSMLTLPPGEKKGLLARFKEFMDPQERTPNVLRKPRPDKPSVKRSVSVDGRGVMSGKERFGGLSKLRAFFSGSKAQAEEADTPTALLEAERSDNAKQKRSSWFHRPLGLNKSIRDRETSKADQGTSQTPQEGDPSPTQSQSTPRTTTLSRTLSAPTQPTRLSIRNAFPPRRRPQLPLQTPSLASTLSNRDLDKWARNGDRVRNSHFIPPFRDPFAGSEGDPVVIPAPWTTGEQTIPAVPDPLQPIPFTSGDPAGPANATEPFPNYQQPSDLEFDAHRGQNTAWVESPAPEEIETYLSDPRYYTSPFPNPRQVSCPQSGPSIVSTATTPQRARPLSPSREASIAAGEAIAQEEEKYVAYRPPPPIPVSVPVPVPSFETRTQHGHDYTAAAERGLVDNSVAELDAGLATTTTTSNTYGVILVSAEQLRGNRGPSEARLPPPPFPPASVPETATLTPVPPIETSTQQNHEYAALDQPPADLAVAELDASPDTTVPTSRTYGVVEFAEELRGRRRSSAYSEDSIDGEKGPAAVAGKAADHAPLMSWQHRIAMPESQMHDFPEELFQWAERQPSVLHQLTYQRLMDSQSPFAGEEEAGGRREGAPLGPGQRHEDVMDPPVAVDSSETMPCAEDLVEDTGKDTLPLKRERASSPVPVLYFTTVAPRNAFA